MRREPGLVLNNRHNDDEADGLPQGPWSRQLDMIEILSTPWSRTIMMFAAIAALIVIGTYILSKWRGTAGEDTMTPNQLLTIFREMHSQGDLSDEEFRTIKAKLSYELQQEIKDSDDEG